MTFARLCSLAVALSLALLPHGARAQLRPGSGDDARGWAPAALGLRIGFDNTQSRPMVGGLARVPVLPSGSVELLPSADVTFFHGFKAYQANFELAYLLAGRRGGVYFGGGAGFRNARFSPDPSAPRSTERTFSLVAGARFGNLGRFRPEIETRWIFLEQQVRDPRQVHVGVSLALW